MKHEMDFERTSSSQRDAVVCSIWTVDTEQETGTVRVCLIE
jgi:hypothetical protein